MINARLMADIGKNDLLKIITGMPEDFIKNIRLPHCRYVPA